MRLFLFLVLALIHMCVSAREISYFLIQGEMCMEAKFEHNCSLYMSLVLSEGSCKSRGYFVKSQFHEQFRLPFLGDVTMDLYYEPEFEGKYKSSSNTNTTMLFMAHETLCVEATINTKYPADFIVSLYPALSYGTCKGHGFSNSSSFYEGSYSIPVFGNMELSVRMKPDTFVDNKKRADETTTLFVTRYGVCAQLVLASNAVPVLGHFEHIMSEGACASQGYTATVEHYNLATVVGPVVLDVFKQNNAFDERTGDTTTSMYVVRFGVCAQLVLDTKAVPVLEHFEHILSEGTCASQGYTASVEHYNLTTVIGPVVLDVFKRDNTRVPLVSTAALKKHPA